MGVKTVKEGGNTSEERREKAGNAEEKRISKVTKEAKKHGYSSRAGRRISVRAGRI